MTWEQSRQGLIPSLCLIYSLFDKNGCCYEKWMYRRGRIHWFFSYQISKFCYWIGTEKSGSVHLSSIYCLCVYVLMLHYLLPTPPLTPPLLRYLNMTTECTVHRTHCDHVHVTYHRLYIHTHMLHITLGTLTVYNCTDSTTVFILFWYLMLHLCFVLLFALSCLVPSLQCCLHVMHHAQSKFLVCWKNEWQYNKF